MISERGLLHIGLDFGKVNYVAAAKNGKGIVKNVSNFLDPIFCDLRHTLLSNLASFVGLFRSNFGVSHI